jgi:hypothetical protein
MRARNYYNFLGGEDYFSKVNKYSGKWVDVDTKCLFCNQYNIVEPNVRLYWWQVAEYDYEGDTLLKVLQTALDKGEVRCHSVLYPSCEFIDLMV